MSADGDLGMIERVFSLDTVLANPLLISLEI